MLSFTGSDNGGGSDSGGSDSERSDKDGNIYVCNPKSLTIKTIDWFEVYRVHYMSHLWAVIVAALVYYYKELFYSLGDIVYGYVSGRFDWANYGFISLLLYIIWKWGPSLRSPVYCIDFEVAQPPWSSLTRSRSRKIKVKAESPKS